MIGIILAAGRGSRMGGLTERSPKCLVSLAGSPLIAWQVRALRAVGIETIVVVGGYRHELLRPYCDSLVVNERWAETNMVASLCAARDWLTAGDCVISYSDIVYHPNAPRALVAADGELVLTFDENWLELWRLRFRDPLSDVESFRYSGNRLLEIGRRVDDLDRIQGQYMGLVKLTPAGWGWIRNELEKLSAPALDRLDMTSLLSRLLAGGYPIGTVAVSGGWCEVDSESDLRAYEKRLAASGESAT